MKVTMLGKSGAGKSTYMSALYESLFVTDVGGFKIAPTAKDINERLGKAGEFRRLSLTGSEDFPPATQRTTFWSFDLLFKTRTVCSFDWIDYRGGMIEEVFGLGYVGDEAKKQEVSQLLGHILLSNAVMIFADSIILANQERVGTRRIQCGANEINAIIESVAQYFPDHTLTVVLLLTKVDSDLIHQSYRDNNYAKLIDVARETFKVTVDTCRNMSPKWSGGIVPVGSVGFGNVKTTITRPPDRRQPLIVENEIIDDPVPYNAEHPIFFSLGHTLMRIESAAAFRREQFANEVSKIEQNSSQFLDFMRWITGKRTSSEAIVELKRNIDEESHVIAELRPFIDPLYNIAKQKVHPI